MRKAIFTIITLMAASYTPQAQTPHPGTSISITEPTDNMTTAGQSASTVTGPMAW